MQLNARHRRPAGVENPFDPRGKVQGGAKFLKPVAPQVEGDLPLALAAYNADPAASIRGVCPPIPETLDYVPLSDGLKERNPVSPPLGWPASWRVPKGADPMGKGPLNS